MAAGDDEKMTPCHDNKMAHYATMARIYDDNANDTTA